MERQQFTREFQLEAVRLISECGVSYAQAAEDLGVQSTQLRDWVKKLTDDPQHAFPGQMKPEQLRIARTWQWPWRLGAYRVFRLSGHDIIALPAESMRLRLIGLQYYYPFTVRRSLFYALLRLAVLMRLDWLLSSWQASPLLSADDGFKEWLAAVCDQLDERGLKATVLWPKDRNRRRTYAHLMRPDGHSVAFCKLAPIGADDSLQREFEILLAMRVQGEGALRSARSPGLIGRGVFRGYSYFLYEPLPKRAMPFRGGWSRIAPLVEELSAHSRLTVRSELEGFAWWEQYVARQSGLPVPFLRQVEAAVDRGIEVCRVHGDLAPANLFETAAGLWVCDWEISTAAAPICTDETSYCLGRNYRRCLAKPESVISELLGVFTNAGRPYPAGDLAAALAFLCSCDLMPAQVLANNWRFIDE